MSRNALLPSSRTGRFWFCLILLGALAIRLAGIQWGIPGELHSFPFHPDEYRFLTLPRRMLLTGDLHPGSFPYGSLHAYLTWLFFLPCSWLGLLEDPSDFFFWGRLPVVLLGTSTVGLCWLLGRRVLGEWGGLWAATLMAVAPGHALHSGFYTVDVPSVFFLTLALVCVFRYLEEPGRWPLLAGGVATGLAAATKYPAGMVGLSLLAAVALKDRRPGSFALPSLGAALAFLLGCPHALLDFPAFWRDLSFELFQHSREGHAGLFAETGNGWLHLFGTNLVYLLGLPLELLGILGLLLLSRRRPRLFWVLMAFALPYAILLGLARIRFMRYALPLVPLLVLGALFLLAEVRDLASRHPHARPLKALLMGLAFLPGSWLALRQALALRLPDGRLEAVAFLHKAVEKNETLGMLAHPHWYTAPVSRYNEGRPAAFYGRPEEEGFRLRFLVDLDGDRLRKAAPDWLLLSEFLWQHRSPRRDAGVRAFFAEVDRSYVLLRAFTSFPPRERWLFGHPRAPHDWLYPFPEIRVYRRKPALPDPAPGR